MADHRLMRGADKECADGGRNNDRRGGAHSEGAEAADHDWGVDGVDSAGAKSTLSIELKYHDGRPVIDRIERISRPGLRIYRGKDELPKVLGGLGVAVISTPQGIMSDAQARAAGTGGEVLFVVQ